MRWILFTTKPCPACKTMKERMNKVGMKYDIVDLSKPEPQYDAKKFFFVRHAPTLLIVDDKDEPIESLVGLYSEEKLKAMKAMYEKEMKHDSQNRR